MNSTCENIERVKEKIKTAAIRGGFDPEDIKLVAVTKNVEVERIVEAISCGVEIIGENRVQEASSKFGFFPIGIQKHLVGHLQINKVKKACLLFDMIQSVDSLRLASQISNRSKEAKREMSVLVEVNTSGEETKFGVNLEEALPLLEGISQLENVKVKGLMTVGLWCGEEKKVRTCFARLKRIFETVKKQDIPNVEMEFLCMGMSGDFEWAIEEGSNMVRIGTAIFGPR